ncbi:T9SS type A sorting domain-containing protein [Kordia sp.]|uniref:T9SS type A sorting domain-containing protein n=1 Tax=Kordia sp. TaxID=1965332 RepID=UPI0025C5E70F|nr:T9SS type A sorting domain-containing protein [Kordia sp.]MCH2194692.1 T9SS type A sorting domain-containing protein [Kordia sp.]
MKTKLLCLSVFLFTNLYCYAQIPANDNCANAEIISVTSTNSTLVNFNNGMATQSLLSSCDTAATPYLDVWYEFTMPVNGNIQITGVNFTDGFSLYNTCGGAEIACFYDDGFFYNLSVGTYKLRAVSTQANAGADSFNIQAFETVVNDECATAEVIMDDITTQRSFNYDNRGATESLDASCDNAINTYLDIWYEFTMPVNGNLQITGVNIFDRFTLYDTCGGTEIVCSADDTFAYNLMTGTYILRVSKQSIYASADSFNLQAFASVANDECATAEVITDDVSTQRTIAYDNRGATESLDASCDNVSNTYHDIWYEFTMPVNGNLHITGVNIFDRFTLYDSCGGAEIMCDADDSFAYNLTTGSYLLRVSKQSIYASADSFNIQAFTVIANDECANAEVITDDITTERTINYDNRGATESLDASCDNAGNTHLDIWYEFTMPVNGNVRITGVNIFDEFTLYDTCGGSELACFNDDGFVYNLTIGTYILRVYKRDIYASADSFNIQAFEATPNNECATAEVITDDITTQRTIFFDNRAATESLNASCDNASNTYLDVWYEFTMPVNGNLRITGVNFLDRFTLYDACGGSELFCDAGSFFVYNLTTGTYYLRAYSQSIHASSESFNIQAFEQLTNDDCANAEMISVAGIGACGTQNITVDLRGSSETVAPNIGDCFSTSQTWLDAWYSFEAPITGNTTLTSTNSNNTFAVYEACGGFEVACFPDDGVIPVTFGNTYYIQAARASNFAGELTFCLEGSPAVAPGSVGVCETMPAIEISTAQDNTNEWVPIFDASSNIVAAINANGNDLGNLNTTLFIENADTRDFSGQPYSRREVSISTSNAPSTNVTVRLYMLGDEVDDLILADSNLTNITGIELIKVSGNTCTAGYVSGGNFINTSSSSYLDTDYYLQFSINSFSVFYPTSTNLSETLSIPSIENNVLGITISPTLTDGIIYIKADTSLADVTLDVFDMTRRNIYQASFEHINQTQQSVNLSGYTSGVYFMKITHQDKQLTKRIILK